MEPKGTEQTYLPTPPELRLLEVMMNPEHRFLSVVETCKMAKISRDSYYKAFRKDRFCRLYREQTMDLIKRAVAPMTHALLREATRGNPQHLKMGLEIAELYAPGVKVSGDLEVIEKVSESQLKDVLASVLAERTAKKEEKNES